MSRGRGQRGRSQATLNLIATCTEIIEACQPISVRGVAYKLFVAGLIDSMAVKNTQKVSRILRDAREEGHIPWDWIVDDSRELERQPHWSDLADYARVIELSYRRDFWADQNWKVIVISEKSTVAGVLRPALEAYGVPFLSAHGFNSATKVHELAVDMSRSRQIYAFLYVGDHDPSGMFMCVDFVDRLKRYGAPEGFLFDRVALTAADTEHLPYFPAKREDPRFDGYLKNYGPLAWELDAMDPNTLRERVRSEIVSFIDTDAWDRHKVIETAQRETTKMVAAQLAAMQTEVQP